MLNQQDDSLKMSFKNKNNFRSVEKLRSAEYAVDKGSMASIFSSW